MMSKRTTWKCLYKFAKALITFFCDQYLHKPTISDIHQLYLAHENKHELHGMPSTINYMHWGRLMLLNVGRGQFIQSDQK